MATAYGMRCGSRSRPPPPATRPRLTSGMPNAESFDATIRSVARASSHPPARQYPSTAAMSGLAGRALGEPHSAALDDDVLATGERLEVHAGAERAARAGQDADRQAVLGIQPVHGVGQPPADRGVHRVRGLGPVDGDDQDAVALFDQDDFFAVGFFAHAGDASHHGLARYRDWVVCKTRTRSNSTRGPHGHDRYRAVGTHQVGSGPDRARDGHHAALPQALLPLGGARAGEPAPRRGPAGVQPLRRHVADGRADPVGGLLREARLRPAAVHAEPRHARGRADRRLLQEDRLHQRQPRERRRGAAVRRPCRGVPRRRLRRIPADAVGEQDRLRRPHRLREGRAERRRADRADGRHRRSGDPDLPDPRHLAGQATRADRAVGPRQDRADLVRLPVRAEPGGPAEHSAARQDHHGRCCRRSTSSPSSARTRTSTRSTRMSGTSCSGRSTNSPPNAGCRSSADHGSAGPTQRHRRPGRHHGASRA